jgi:hypothetical protein
MVRSDLVADGWYAETMYNEKLGIFILAIWRYVENDIEAKNYSFTYEEVYRRRDLRKLFNIERNK